MAVAHGRSIQAITGFVCMTCLHAGDAGVAEHQWVPITLRNIVIGKGLLMEIMQILWELTHDVFRQYRNVSGTNFMGRCRQSVDIVKMAMVHAKLMRSLVHHIDEFISSACDGF